MEHPNAMCTIGHAHLGTTEKALPRCLTNIKSIEASWFTHAAMSLIGRLAVDHRPLDRIRRKLLGQEIGLVLPLCTVPGLVHVEINSIYKTTRQIRTRA